MDKMFEKWGGGEVLRRAVRGMLPKNRLRDKRLARLKSEYTLISISIGDIYIYICCLYLGARLVYGMSFEDVC